MTTRTSRSTIHEMLGVSAPNAMRVPISLVRRATVYESTPYRPIIASSVASAPKTAASSAIRRSVDSERATWSSIVVTS
jgi:hypothetical protein